MLAEGLALLELSASGTEVTEYHLEAAIASIHATAADHASTDWARIIGLYDSLLALRNSPVIALNRAIAVGQFFGADRGILELESLDHLAELPDYPFYEAALGEFEFRRNRIEVAAAHFAHAAALARNPLERRHLERRLGAARSIDDATRLGHDGV